MSSDEIIILTPQKAEREKVNGKFECLHCDYRTARLKDLKTHEKHHEVGFGKHLCPICTFSDNRADYVQAHVRKIHLEENEENDPVPEEVIYFLFL